MKKEVLSPQSPLSGISLNDWDICSRIGKGGGSLPQLDNNCYALSDEHDNCRPFITCPEEIQFTYPWNEYLAGSISCYTLAGECNTGMGCRQTSDCFEGTLPNGSFYECVDECCEMRNEVCPENSFACNNDADCYNGEICDKVSVSESVSINDISGCCTRQNPPYSSRALDRCACDCKPKLHCENFDCCICNLKLQSNYLEYYGVPPISGDMAMNTEVIDVLCSNCCADYPHYSELYTLDNMFDKIPGDCAYKNDNLIEKIKDQIINQEFAEHDTADIVNHCECSERPAGSVPIYKFDWFNEVHIDMYDNTSTKTTCIPEVSNNCLPGFIPKCLSVDESMDSCSCECVTATSEIYDNECEGTPCFYHHGAEAGVLEYSQICTDACGRGGMCVDGYCTKTGGIYPENCECRGFNCLECRPNHNISQENIYPADQLKSRLCCKQCCSKVMAADDPGGVGDDHEITDDPCNLHPSQIQCLIAAAGGDDCQWDADTNTCYTPDEGIIVDPIYGCTDARKCNYNSHATIDDGTCAASMQNVGGDFAGYDCAGVCGGDAATDSCGLCICGFNITGQCGGLTCAPGYTCTQSNTYDSVWQCLGQGPDDNEEERTEEDWTNVAVLGEMPYCNPVGPAIALSYEFDPTLGLVAESLYSQNLLEDSILMDACGTCIPCPIVWDDVYDCIDEYSPMQCWGNVGGEIGFVENYQNCPLWYATVANCTECPDDSPEDECGICGGDNSTCLDCNGIPNGTWDFDECDICVENPNAPSEALDCAGICNGTAVVDNCGVCEGANEDVDCTGTCFGDAIIDICGICDGDNSTCMGCTDNVSCNYDANVNIDDGSCLTDLWDYNHNSYGIMTDGVDCYGTCGGYNIIDSCGVCVCELYNHPIYGSAPSTFSAASTPFGDVNGDGYVGIIDIYEIMRNSVGKNCITCQNKPYNNQAFVEIQVLVKKLLEIDNILRKFNEREIYILNELDFVLNTALSTTGKQSKVRGTKLLNRVVRTNLAILEGTMAHYSQFWMYERMNAFNSEDLEEYMKITNDRENLVLYSSDQNTDSFCGGNSLLGQTPIDDCGVCGGDGTSCIGCTDPLATNWMGCYGYQENCITCTQFNSDCINGQEGENCCCDISEGNLPETQYAVSIQNILGMESELLTIYSRIRESREECVSLLKETLYGPNTSGVTEELLEQMCVDLYEISTGVYVNQCTLNNNSLNQTECASVCGSFCQEGAIWDATCVNQYNTNFCRCNCTEIPSDGEESD